MTRSQSNQVHRLILSRDENWERALVLFVGAILVGALTIVLAAVMTAVGGAFAIYAHSQQRRIDSIFARAVACDLAEGRELPEDIAEAA